MSKVNNILDETLIDEQIMKVEDKPKTVVKTNNEGNDFEYQRQNFYSLVEKGQDAIEGILDLARESEHPRTYEGFLDNSQKMLQRSQRNLVIYI